MTIEKIDNECIIIVLSYDDIQIFSLDFDKMTKSSNYSKKIIKKLLTIASSHTGVDIRNKNLYIEVCTSKDSCIFVVTLSEKRETASKTYRIKKTVQTRLYNFETIDDMLSCLETLYKSGFVFYKSDVYVLDKKYSIVISTTKEIPLGAMVILSEYGKGKGNNIKEINRLKEFGKAIARDSAILTIGGTFALRE